MYRAVPHRALLGHHHLKQALFLASFRPNLKTFKTSQRPKIKDYYFLWCLYNLFMKCFCCFDDVFMFFKLTTIFLMKKKIMYLMNSIWLPARTFKNWWNSIILLFGTLGKMVTTIGWEPAKIPESKWKLKRTLEKTYLFTQCLWICYEYVTMF